MENYETYCTSLLLERTPIKSRSFFVPLTIKVDSKMSNQFFYRDKQEINNFHSLYSIREPFGMSILTSKSWCSSKRTWLFFLYANASKCTKSVSWFLEPNRLPDAETIYRRYLSRLGMLRLFLNVFLFLLFLERSFWSAKGIFYDSSYLSNVVVYRSTWFQWSMKHGHFIWSYSTSILVP